MTSFSPEPSSLCWPKLAHFVIRLLRPKFKLAIAEEQLLKGGLPLEGAIDEQSSYFL